MNDDYISREEVLNLIDTAFENGAFDGRYAYENLIDAVQNLIHPLETDCISRQAAIDILDDVVCDYESGRLGNLHSEARGRMINLPSAEPERKTGHWEWDQRTGEYVCSECGCNPIYERTTPDVSEINKYRYCRWCGAKMEFDTGAKMEVDTNGTE